MGFLRSLSESLALILGSESLSFEILAIPFESPKRRHQKKLKHPRISLEILMETLLRAPISVAPKKVKTSEISIEILIKMLLDVLTFCHQKKLKHLKFLLKS